METFEKTNQTLITIICRSSFLKALTDTATISVINKLVTWPEAIFVHWFTMVVDLIQDIN